MVIRVVLICLVLTAYASAQTQTVEQRLGVLIGQVIIDNTKIGAEVEQLRADLIKEKARADAAEQKLKNAECREK